MRIAERLECGIRNSDCGIEKEKQGECGMGNGSNADCGNVLKPTGAMRNKLNAECGLRN